MYIFNERLKELRIAANLTQKELASKVGMSARGVQNYELIITKPTYDCMIVLAEFFDVSLDYLVGRTDNPQSHKN